MSSRSDRIREEVGRWNAGEVSDINPQIDAREVLHRADGTPAGSSMLWKFRMRPRTDRKESSRSKSTASKALERSSSATPKGGGGHDRQNLSYTALLPRTTAASSPKGQDEASGHPPERGENRQEYLQAHVQTWEEKSRLGHLRKTPKKTNRTSPGGEKNDQGKENDPEDASSSLYRSHCWTSDGDTC